MKKIQPIDESGRRMAMERYGKIEDQSKHGHSQMHRDMRPKFDTPSHTADKHRNVGAKHPDRALPPAEPVMDAPGPEE